MQRFVTSISQGSHNCYLWRRGSWTTGVRFPAGSRIPFSSSLPPDRLCGPYSLLSNGYWEHIIWG